MSPRDFREDLRGKVSGRISGRDAGAPRRSPGKSVGQSPEALKEILGEELRESRWPSSGRNWPSRLGETHTCRPRLGETAGSEPISAKWGPDRAFRRGASQLCASRLGETPGWRPSGGNPKRQTLGKSDDRSPAVQLPSRLGETLNRRPRLGETACSVPVSAKWGPDRAFRRGASHFFASRLGETARTAPI